MAQIARHVDGTSAFTSANHRVSEVPERACRTDETLVQSPEHGLGVRCKVIHVAVFSARQFRGSAMLCRMYKWHHFQQGEPGSVGPGSNGSARFRVTTHRFGSLLCHGAYKRRIAKPFTSCLASLSGIDLCIHLLLRLPRLPLCPLTVDLRLPISGSLQSPADFAFHPPDSAC